MTAKLPWRGRVTSVQPRIRLSRSFDQRSHSYLGYVLAVEETAGDQESSLLVAVGKAAQAQHRFRFGDEASGQSAAVADPRKETTTLDKTSRLRLLHRAESAPREPPPWHGEPPELDVYRQRGHRRLAARTYDTHCASCIWGCRMPVEMIIDHWNPRRRRYRFETFCYGPKSCGLYKAGPTRKVPGRRGMTWEEEDWIDEDATAHRDPDD